MPKYTHIFIGMTLGLFLGSIVTYFWIADAKRDFGRHEGEISGGLKVITFLDQHFFTTNHHAGPSDDILDHKDRSVVVKKIGNITTIETW
jgi:hypothetical protein